MPTPRLLVEPRRCFVVDLGWRRERNTTVAVEEPFGYRAAIC
jgi:hypothetical protein